MNYGKRLTSYDKTNIKTAGKLDLVIFCYDKAIEFLLQSKAYYEKNEIENKARKMQKALDIINELQCSLDIEKGGEIAKNLNAIYNYLTRRILLGDIKKDLTALDEAVHIMEELRSAWEEIASGTMEQPDNVTVPIPNKTQAVQVAA